MPVLYRKYRPQVFSDLSGQDHVKKTLREEVASSRIAHSYLFTGPRGIGKTTTARIFAKALNCNQRSEGEGEPCGGCDSCLQIVEGRSLDVIEIDAASHTGVDNVREQIIDNTRFSPANAPYKVFIIDEVHMLSTSAFNALLKTLEEPPEHVVFILATTELHKLPATVVSRCQRFDFKKIGKIELVARLQKLTDAEGLQVDDGVYQAIARVSEGCLRDAESLLSQIFSLGERHVTMEVAEAVMPNMSSDTVCRLADAVYGKDVPAALAEWERISVEGGDLDRVLNDLIDLTRQLALSKLRGDTGLRAVTFPLSEDWVKRFSGRSERHSSAEFSSLLKQLIRVREEMRRMELAELPFEMMVFEWSDDGTAPEIPPPLSTEIDTEEDGGASADEPPQEEMSAREKDEDQVLRLQEVRKKWQQILEAAQAKNQGLPYMLGVGELVGLEGNEVQIGFQYALYKDRVNGKCKRMLEEVFSEVMKTRMLVRGVLIKNDEATEAKNATEKLPDGFSDLVSEFGGTLSTP